MKLSFSTLGCPEWSFSQVLSGARKYGMDGIEIRGIGPVLDNREIPEFQEQALPETIRQIWEAQLEIPVLGTSCAFHTPERYAHSIEEGREAVSLCEKLRIPYLRVFGDALEGDPEEAVRLVNSGLSELCRLAAQSGVGVLLEVHGDFNTCETMERVLEQSAQYQNFGILWDVEHSDRAYGDHWEGFYRLIAPFIRHVHIKDCIRESSEHPLILTLPGKGEIPLRDIVERLLADGYQGYFSLEWEKRWKPELDGIDEALACFTDLMEKWRE